eukprot:TRINITY_DN53_c0_g1_i1.p1 TRINITY_DN53_c0_g1~~TRINITY_DN53_c0_g1_i1.p1  ORF type:complete len:369 (-),score=59.62 TRINITY_DN53_c0_g1_i1:77-1183(-)
MFWPAVAATLSLVLTVKAQQDFEGGRQQDFEGGRIQENRRRGSVDEDADEYIYQDYDVGNGIGPVVDPPRGRVPQTMTQRKQYSNSNSNNYNYNQPARPSQQNLMGKEACKSGAKTVGHESSCDLYYECYEGQGFITSCPSGLVYNNDGRFGLIGVCDYPFNINCQGREERNPPQSTEHCDWLYGIFGHETSCTRYWTCWNGTATEQFCIGGLLYNEETHACDWPQNVAGCQKHPLCKDDANGNVPLGKSCNRYWACQGGYPRLQRCPAMLVFDKNRRRCVTPPTEDCEVPTTKAPPPGEENFNSGSGSRGNSGSGGRQQSPNPRRGGGQRRQQESPPRRQQSPQPLEASEPLPFNLPPGAVPLNTNN